MADWRDEARSLTKTFAWVYNTADPDRLRLAMIDLQSSLEHILEGFIGEIDPGFDVRAASFSDLLQAAQRHVSVSASVIVEIDHFNRLRNRIVHHRGSVDKRDVESSLASIDVFANIIARTESQKRNDEQIGERQPAVRQRIKNARSAAEGKFQSIQIGKRADGMSFLEVAGTAIVGNVMIAAITVVALAILAILILALIIGWSLADTFGAGGGVGGIVSHVVLSVFVAVCAVVLMAEPAGIIAGIILAIVSGLAGLANGIVMVVIFLLARIASRQWWRFRVIPFGIALIVCTALWAYLGASLNMQTWDVLVKVSAKGLSEKDAWVITGCAIAGFLATLITEVFLTMSGTDVAEAT